MIKDFNEYNKFLEVLPELEKDEVYFVSISVRNKYLTSEERDYYCLGRTEIFARAIANSKEELTNVLTQVLPAKLLTKRTKNGKKIKGAKS